MKNKSARLNMRLDPDVKAGLEQEAKKRGKTITEIITELIRKYLIN